MKMNVLGIMVVVTTTVLTQLEVITVHVTTIAILFTQIITHVYQVKCIIIILLLELHTHDRMCQPQ